MALGLGRYLEVPVLHGIVEADGSHHGLDPFLMWFEEIWSQIHHSDPRLGILKKMLINVGQDQDQESRLQKSLLPQRLRDPSRSQVTPGETSIAGWCLATERTQRIRDQGFL
jgi:hypothetical protein